MHTSLKTIIIALAAAAPLCGSAAEAWTLDSCVSYAVSHNINVKMRELQIRQGEQDITEAKDRFLPSLDGSVGQSFNFGRGLTAENTYANRNTSNFQWGLGMSLPLFQGGAEYKRIKVAKASLVQLLYENEAAKDNVTLNVISQYLQVLYCKEVEASAKAQAELSAFEVERRKALVDAGSLAEASLYDAEALAAQDALQVVTSANDTQVALVNLANLLQLPTAEGFDILPLPDDEPLIPRPEAVYDAALGNNNALLGARQAVAVAGHNISLAKAGYMPSLSLSAGTGSSFYTVSGFDHESFSAQMRHNLSTYIGFSLRIPIFDGFSTRNSVRRAKLQKSSAQLNLDLAESNLYKEIQLAYYQASGARERFITSGETLDKTERSFEAVSERFNLGRATQADYEQAKTNLFRTQVTRIQARYEYLMRYRILMFYANPRL